MALFEGDLWTTVEEEETETYVDASGRERQERVQPMPPPSLTRGGPVASSSHVLERHTGDFRGRAVKGDSVPSEDVFDDTENKAFSRPDTAPLSHQQGLLVSRNRSGDQGAPEREDASRDDAMYHGYNLKDPDLSRAPKSFPITNRSCEPESTWYDRSTASILPKVSVLGKAPTTRKHGTVDVESTTDRSKKALGNWDHAVRKPVNILSRNAAYDTQTVHDAAKKSLHVRPAPRSKGLAGVPRPEHATDENEHRVTNVAQVSHTLPSDLPLTDGRDGNAVDRMAMATGDVPSLQEVVPSDLPEEILYDDMGVERATHQDVARYMKAKGVVGCWDSTAARDAVRTMDNKALPTHTTVHGAVGLNPQRDSTRMRDGNAPLRAHVEQMPIHAFVSATQRPEIWDTRNPIRTHHDLQASDLRQAPGKALRQDASLVPRTGPGTLGTAMAMFSRGLRRPLRDDTIRPKGDPRHDTTTALFQRRGIPGQLKVGDNDAMVVEDATQRVRNELQRVGPRGGTAREPRQELDKRPSVAPQVSQWEVRGPLGKRDNVPRDMHRADFHDNTRPLPTAVSLNAVPSHPPKSSGRETPTFAPRSGFLSSSTTMPDFSSVLLTSRKEEVTLPVRK